MPVYEHHLFICTNERGADDVKGSCAHKGSLALLDHAKARCFAAGLKGRARVNATACLNACAVGPAAVVYGAHNAPGGVWYTLRDAADVDAVIDEHLVGGAVVERLRQR